MLSFFPQVKIGRIRTGLAEAPLLPDLRSVVLLIIVLQSKAIFRRNTSCLSPPLNSLTTGILCIVVLTIAAQKSSPTSSPLLSMAALTVEHLKVRVYLLPLSNK